LSDEQILEGLVASALSATRYWKKNKKEVDFLRTNGEIIPVEVEKKDKIDPVELRGLVWLMDNYKANNGAVVYRGRENAIDVKGKKVVLYPLMKLLFNFSLR
jgi:predicted AAA+ superfamily ATPase